jgi:hypothetical protein
MLVDSTGNSGAASVTGAIRGAAQASGASFEYMLATAQIESGFNPHAAASTSSAGGLYQFIDQTWLGMLKDAGPSLGYGRYANAITQSSSGHYEVADPGMRQEIMALRKDPTANAAMAGAFTQQNAGKLASQIGRSPSEGELYIAHFLGPAGAAKLINSAAGSPLANAAAMFPEAAAANHSIFYDKQGAPRSASDVYGVLVHRYDTARAGPTATPNTNAALIAPPIPPADIPGVTGTNTAGNGASPISHSDRVALVPLAAFDAPTAATSQATDTKPAFHALFRTGEYHGGINPVVQELWGSRGGSLTSDPTPSSSSSASSSTAPVSSSSSTAGASSKDGMLNLFSDQPANVRALFGNKS